MMVEQREVTDLASLHLQVILNLMRKSFTKVSVRLFTRLVFHRVLMGEFGQNCVNFGLCVFTIGVCCRVRVYKHATSKIKNHQHLTTLH